MLILADRWSANGDFNVTILWAETEKVLNLAH